MGSGLLISLWAAEISGMVCVSHPAPCKSAGEWTRGPHLGEACSLPLLAANWASGKLLCGVREVQSGYLDPSLASPSRVASLPICRWLCLPLGVGG